MKFGDDRLCHTCGGKGTINKRTCTTCSGSGIESITKGRELRDHAMASVVNVERPWSDVAQRWIANVPIGATFDAERMTDEIGLPEHRGAVGAAVALAARRGLIERAGLSQPSRPSSHASVIQLWLRK